MNVGYGNGENAYGSGVRINLSGDEVATAIDAWLVAHEVVVSGPRTIRVNGELIDCGQVVVDPSGTVIVEGNRLSGRGEKKS